MNIGITGASGFIGQRIVDLALRRGHDITAFSRTPERDIAGCAMRLLPPDSAPDLAGCEAVLHLAGEPITGVWTPSKKRRIKDSRVLGTRRIVDAVNGMADPPEVLVCGSATGLYADGGEVELDERAASGSGFLPGTVQAWEAEAQFARGTRIVLLRTSIVLGTGGGALAAMLPIFRAGLGGPLGSGRQWMPWIHIDDEAMLALFAVENLDIAGPLNAASPFPVRNADFAHELAAALHRPAFLRVPAIALRALGEFSRELLESKRVVPQAAVSHRFGFRFPDIRSALKDLLG